MENNSSNKNHGDGAYFDRALIKLRRIYSKDETVSALSKKLSDVEIELGKSIAYIHELEDEKNQRNLKYDGEYWFEKYKKLQEQFDKTTKEAKLDELYLMRSKENAKLRDELNKQRKTNRDLICKIVQLENKIASQ